MIEFTSNSANLNLNNAIYSTTLTTHIQGYSARVTLKMGRLRAIMKSNNLSQIDISNEEIGSLNGYIKRKNTAVLTVMFTDIKNFTLVTEEKGEKYSREIREAHDKLLTNIIQKNNDGLVIKFIGDAVMAVFSEPSSAVERALEIQKAITAFNNNHPEYEDLSIRIGMHMGQVAVDDNVQADVFGRHVNRASRIESLADGGQIYLSYTVFDSAKGWLSEHENIQWQPHGRYLVKGIKEPIEVYEVLNNSHAKPRAPLNGKKQTNFPKGLISVGLVVAGFIFAFSLSNYTKIESGSASLSSDIGASNYANNADTAGEQTNPVILNGVSIDSWMYQIQGLDENAKIDSLAVTDYDMLVVEPGNDFIDFSYDTDYLVKRLERKLNGDDRILLAYADIGQASDYRSYWQSDWIAPTKNKRGSPSFLITTDPDGWVGNYPVAYWQSEWKEIWLKPDGIVAKLAKAGFHGIYLDWVEAYDDDAVRDVALLQGVSPENEMMLFIEQIGAAGRAIRPDFIVIAQNAPYLINHNPARYVAMIDGIATEDTWFFGEGDAEWDDANAGDLTGGERHYEEYSTTNRISQNQIYLSLGVPVFTVDYCISEKNANLTYSNSRRAGFIPLVTRVSLSELSETPPN